MINGFDVTVIVEHGCPHYRIIDVNTGNEAHCDMNELNKMIEELSQDDCDSYKELNYCY